MEPDHTTADTDVHELLTFSLCDNFTNHSAVVVFNMYSDSLRQNRAYKIRILAVESSSLEMEVTAGKHVSLMGCVSATISYLLCCLTAEEETALLEMRLY